MKKSAQVKAAVDFLGREIYDKVFFAKLASYGITPRNEAEKHYLTTLVYQLRKNATPFLGDTDTAPDNFTKATAKALVKDARIRNAARIILENM